MKNGLKQLFRKPMKVILFFLLMTAATVLLVFGGAMFAQSRLRMGKLDDLFVTMGTVDQPKLEEGDEKLSPEDLLFPGAEYVIEPELRPYYLAYLPEFTRTVQPSYYDLLEVRVTETIPEDMQASAEVAKVWWDGKRMSEEEYFDAVKPATVKEGDVIRLSNDPDSPLEAGKTYIGYFRQVYNPGKIDQYAAELGYDPDNTESMNDFYLMLHAMRDGAVTITSDGGGAAQRELTTWTKVIKALWEYSPVPGPFTTQCDPHGDAASSAVIPSGYGDEAALVEEVTPDFYEEGGRGGIWMDFLEQIKMSYQLYPVLAITRAELLESFQQSNVHVRGRMITREEYDAGAKVCMVSSTVAQKNFLSPGDKITLPMLCALYGYEANREEDSFENAQASVWDGDNPSHVWFHLPKDCSLLDAKGKLYKPFWEEEYEIVGVFHARYATNDLYYQNMFLVPKNSVGASDENNIAYFGRMTKSMTSFQLKNGAVEEFDKALHEAVPQAEELTIQYSDMGYAAAEESLRSTQKTALLLLAIGLLAAVTIVALLLYFFIVQEKKRTAIERSLGLSKRQCRVSLLSGLLMLTLAAAVLGSASAGVLLNKADSFRQMQSVGEEIDGEVVATASSNMDLGGVYHFNARYSPWAMWDVKGNQAELETVAAPRSIFIAAPLLLFLLVWLLALLLVNRNLKIEPIYLLSEKE